MARHVPRIYSEQRLVTGHSLRLGEEVSHHLLKVLRLAGGAEVILFDGSGGEYSAVIAATGKNWLEVTVNAHRPVNRESALHVTLAQGISRGERMDYSIQKAVELGVNIIQPLETSRSVSRLDDERAARRLRHWREVARSAAEQCGRDRLPEVEDIRTLQDWLTNTDTTTTRLLLYPESGRSLSTLPRGQRLSLLVGPEGGLDPAEIAQAVESGHTAVRLGPRILRTETAGVAALSALQTLWGDLVS